MSAETYCFVPSKMETLGINKARMATRANTRNGATFLAVFVLIRFSFLIIKKMLILTLLAQNR